MSDLAHKQTLSLLYFFKLVHEIIIKSVDPLRAKKTFTRKQLGHTAVSAIKASSVTLLIWQKELKTKNEYLASVL